MGLNILNLFKSGSEAEGEQTKPKKQISPQKPISKEETVFSGGMEVVKDLKSNGMSTEKTTKSPVTYHVLEVLEGNINPDEMPEIAQHTGETGNKVFSSSFGPCQLVVFDNGMFHSYDSYGTDSAKDVAYLEARVSGEKSNYYVMPALPHEFNEHQKNSYIFIKEKPDSEKADLYYIDKDKKPHKMETDVRENAKLLEEVRDIVMSNLQQNNPNASFDFQKMDFYLQLLRAKEALGSSNPMNPFRAEKILETFSNIDNMNEEKKKNISTPKMKEVLIFQKEGLPKHQKIAYLALEMAVRFNCKNIKVIPEKNYYAAYMENGKLTVCKSSNLTRDNSKATNFNNLKEAEEKETTSYLDLKECFEQVFAMEKQMGSTITRNEKGDFYFPGRKLTVPVEFVPEEYRKESMIKTPKQAMHELETKKISTEDSSKPSEQQPPRKRHITVQPGSKIGPLSQKMLETVKQKYDAQEHEDKKVQKENK